MIRTLIRGLFFALAGAALLAAAALRPAIGSPLGAVSALEAYKPRSDVVLVHKRKWRRYHRRDRRWHRRHRYYRPYMYYYGPYYYPYYYPGYYPYYRPYYYRPGIIFGFGF